ncbi:hypothetical protein [Krasilnikovia sp. MM14-A1004]|uniref:hypothetical protein n=1 Tax=Krasilnikovia sp. MM14-A1004 TaxID=3373541 RepID=UPI00399C635D
MGGDLYHGRISTGAVHIVRGAPGPPGSRYRNVHQVDDCLVRGLRHDRDAAVAAYARDLAGRPDLVAAARFGHANPYVLGETMAECPTAPNDGPRLP